MGGIVETAQKVKNMDSTLENKQKSFEQSAKTQPLKLFKAMPQRACPWSQYKKDKDWSFASKKSDDKEECARACVAAKGCTGFEVGPHTSQHYNFISYCAHCGSTSNNDEKKMLHLSPGGYVATTFVMVKTVTVDVKTQEKTIFGLLMVEEKKTFQPDESKEHCNSIHKQDKSEVKKPAKTKKHVKTKKQSHHEQKSKKQNIQVRTTMHSDSVARFEEFPQLACEFSQYKKGDDWEYTKVTSGDTEACADACLDAGDCTGFEIGINSKRGEYCAIWKSGACSTKKSMTSIPQDGQTVSTFVLASYHHQEGVAIDGFALFDQVNPPKFDCSDDMAGLTFLGNPCIYWNSVIRYVNQLIYTYSGLFCIAINPYKRFPIYTLRTMELYVGKRRNECPPHIFAIAEGAYQGMSNSGI